MAEEVLSYNEAEKADMWAVVKSCLFRFQTQMYSYRYEGASSDNESAKSDEDIDDDEVKA